MIVTSPDLNVFDFRTIYDLTDSSNPKVVIQNLSTGPNVVHANVTYWFIIKTPSGNIFHQGSQGAPDRTSWNADYNVPEKIPMIQGHIEWSGANYEIIGFAKDTADNVFQTPAYPVRICRPPGNQLNQKNNYGLGILAVSMNCCTAKLLVEDSTNYTYNGATGINVAKVTKLVFPPDNTGSTPAPFVENDTSSSEIPVTYNSDGYIILMDADKKYEFANNIQVIIRFKFKATFSINCGTQLCSILCAIRKFEDQLQSEGCNSEDREKLLLVMSKLTRALAGLIQPLCGENVPKIINEIKELLGGCKDCEGVNTGINPLANCAVPLDLVAQPLF